VQRPQPPPLTTVIRDELVCAHPIILRLRNFDRTCAALSILGYYLQIYLDGNDRGFTFGGDGMIRVAKDQVRMPDLSFFLWERFPNHLLPAGQILGMVPDLAVEVLSPSNTPREMERKRREYFAGGCKQVWEVDPDRRSVRVYVDAEHFTEVSEDGMLEGGDLLPGFTLSVRRWFEKAGRRKEE
jgi:Uma2 family endonuclease